MNPFTNRSISEASTGDMDLFVKSLFFINSKAFHTTKARAKGRIKRKIRRRVY
jgi:hypothetical protein